MSLASDATKLAAKYKRLKKKVEALEGYPALNHPRTLMTASFKTLDQGFLHLASRITVIEALLKESEEEEESEDELGLTPKKSPKKASPKKATPKKKAVLVESKSDAGGAGAGAGAGVVTRRRAKKKDPEPEPELELEDEPEDEAEGDSTAEEEEGDVFAPADDLS